MDQGETPRDNKPLPEAEAAGPSGWRPINQDDNAASHSQPQTASQDIDVRYHVANIVDKLEEVQRPINLASLLRFFNIFDRTEVVEREIAHLLRAHACVTFVQDPRYGEPFGYWGGGAYQHISVPKPEPEAPHKAFGRRNRRSSASATNLIPFTYPQHGYTSRGQDLRINIVYAVGRLRGYKKPVTLDYLLGYLNLVGEPETVLREFADFLRTDSRVIFTPDPENSDWAAGTYEAAPFTKSSPLVSYSDSDDSDDSEESEPWLYDARPSPPAEGPSKGAKNTSSFPGQPTLPPWLYTAGRERGVALNYAVDLLSDEGPRTLEQLLGHRRYEPEAVHRNLARDLQATPSIIYTPDPKGDWRSGTYHVAPPRTGNEVDRVEFKKKSELSLFNDRPSATAKGPSNGPNSTFSFFGQPGASLPRYTSTGREIIVDLNYAVCHLIDEGPRTFDQLFGHLTYEPEAVHRELAHALQAHPHIAFIPDPKNSDWRAGTYRAAPFQTRDEADRVESKKRKFSPDDDVPSTEQTPAVNPPRKKRKTEVELLKERQPGFHFDDEPLPTRRGGRKAPERGPVKAAPKPRKKAAAKAKLPKQMAKAEPVPKAPIAQPEPDMELDRDEAAGEDAELGVAHSHPEPGPLHPLHQDCSVPEGDDEIDPETLAELESVNTESPPKYQASVHTVSEGEEEEEFARALEEFHEEPSSPEVSSADEREEETPASAGAETPTEQLPGDDEDISPPPPELPTPDDEQDSITIQLTAAPTSSVGEEDSDVDVGQVEQEWSGVYSSSSDDEAEPSPEATSPMSYSVQVEASSSRRPSLTLHEVMELADAETDKVVHSLKCETEAEEQQSPSSPVEDDEYSPSSPSGSKKVSIIIYDPTSPPSPGPPAKDWEDYRESATAFSSPSTGGFTSKFPELVSSPPPVNPFASSTSPPQVSQPTSNPFSSLPLPSIPDSLVSQGTVPSSENPLFTRSPAQSPFTPPKPQSQGPAKPFYQIPLPQPPPFFKPAGPYVPTAPPSQPFSMPAGPYVPTAPPLPSPIKPPSVKPAAPPSPVKTTYVPTAPSSQSPTAPLYTPPLIPPATTVHPFPLPSLPLPLPAPNPTQQPPARWALDASGRYEVSDEEKDAREKLLEELHLMGRWTPDMDARTRLMVEIGHTEDRVLRAKLEKELDEMPDPDIQAGTHIGLVVVDKTMVKEEEEVEVGEVEVGEGVEGVEAFVEEEGEGDVDSLFGDPIEGEGEGDDGAGEEVVDPDAELWEP